MKPAAFEYVRAESAEHAVAELARWDGDATVLAGGQSLLPLLNMRLAVPGALVDIGRIPGFGRVAVGDGGTIEIGAAATQAAVEDDVEVAARVPLLRAALGHVAHREIRNAGTVCGSLAHADPSAELPAVAVTLDAEFVVRGADGTRTVPADAFFTSFFTTCLEEDELLEQVRIRPPSGRWFGAFEEIAVRRGDFAVVGLAAMFEMTDDGLGQVRLTACGAGPVPQRLRAAEVVLTGSDGGPEALREAADAARGELDPPNDLHGSADYRRAQVAVLLGRALDASGGDRTRTEV